jgi:hypothetical protein
LIDVEVVDKDGNRCPTALNPINFTLSGEAEWRGGIAQGPDNYILSKRLPVENGVNRILIRSTTKPGKIFLSASAENLKPAKVELASRSFQTKDGLAFELPANNLPSNLSRGATPLGESFAPSRFPVQIAGVSSGSNSNQANNTIDDDETTLWTSDGKAGTAWIKFDFAKPENVSQVVLKLVGWRTHSYPIRISVDGKAVFTGQTQRSLGYVTISFPDTVGKSVKIELTGEASNRDAFGNITEIAGQPDLKSAADKGGKDRLALVEAEIYTASKGK